MKTRPVPFHLHPKEFMMDGHAKGLQLPADKLTGLALLSYRFKQVSRNAKLWIKAMLDGGFCY